MVFNRIESVVFYTCTILFVLLLGFIFYRVIVVIWQKLCLLFDRLGWNCCCCAGANTSGASSDRVMELLHQRPQIRDILAHRVAEASTSRVSQKPMDSVDNRSLPPSYDSLSLHSGPPPSYHSDIDIDR